MENKTTNTKLTGMEYEPVLSVALLSNYIPYSLKLKAKYDLRDEYDYEEFGGLEEQFIKDSIWVFAGYSDADLYIPVGEGDLDFVFRSGSTWISCNINHFLPILKPLDLEELIISEFEKPLKDQDPIFRQFFNDDYFDLVDGDVNNTHPDFYSVGALKWLLKNHYDVFGLIKKGLAVAF